MILKKNKNVDISENNIIVAYPRTGSSWLYQMIVRLWWMSKYNEDCFEKIGIEFNPEVRGKLDFTKTHFFDPHLKQPKEIVIPSQTYAQKKVIFLFRDPRDTIVSLYHFRKDRRKNYSSSISSFIREKKGGIDSLITFYSIWFDYQKKYPDSAMYLSYEMLHKNTHKELNRCMDFLGINCDADFLCNTIELFSFKQSFSKEMENPHRGTEVGNVNSFHNRKGVVGSYEQELDKESISYLNKKLESIKFFQKHYMGINV